MARVDKVGLLAIGFGFGVTLCGTVATWGEILTLYSAIFVAVSAFTLYAGLWLTFKKNNQADSKEY